MILRAEALVKRYGDFVAVDGINLTLGAGRCLAMLGPNGAGKTSTIEMLTGLLRPSSGNIEIFSQDIEKHRQVILEKVGVLFQETRLYKKLTVRETLELFASFYKEPEDPSTIITNLGLIDKADVRLENLSGGQRQRAYLGCALINKPELIFLDEPTTGLDPQARRMIWTLLKELKDSGCSIFLTTHYMDEAQILADEVSIIDQGKVIATGTPDELIRSISSDQLIRVSFADGSGEAVRQKIDSRFPWFEHAKEDNGAFLVSTSSAAKHIGELSQAAPELGLSISDLAMRSCTLEDVFLTLTGRQLRDE